MPDDAEGVYELPEHVQGELQDELLAAFVCSCYDCFTCMLLTSRSLRAARRELLMRHLWVVEFRRIVVSCRGIGIGQAAIPAMEVYCREQLHCRRIWLDVFDSNPRGRHIYQKLGYRLFDTGELEGRKLLYMDKSLTDPAGKPR